MLMSYLTNLVMRLAELSVGVPVENTIVISVD